MDPLATRESQRVPCVLLVGMTEAVTEACSKALDPFPVLRAPHAQAAITRMPIVMPTLVVLDATWSPTEVARQIEVATAVGARVLYAASADDAGLPGRLREALGQE